MAAFRLHWLVVDTIVLRLERSLLKVITSKRSPLPHGWAAYAKGSAVVYEHRPSGIRAVSRNGIIDKVEASLPRVLYGTNGKLIKTDSELNNALAALNTALGSISSPSTVVPVFTRIDVVWQFKGDVRAYIAAFRHAKHPYVRKEPVIYGSEGICFPGKLCRLSFYDKPRQLKRKSGKVVRAEILLRGSKLKALLGKGNPVKQLSFFELYRAYRSVLFLLQPQPVPVLSSVAELIALSERNGIDAFNYWSLLKSVRQVRRMKAAVAATQIHHYGLNWRQKLRSLTPPTAVEVS